MGEYSRRVGTCLSALLEMFIGISNSQAISRKGASSPLVEQTISCSLGHSSDPGQCAAILNCIRQNAPAPDGVSACMSFAAKDGGMRLS